MTIDYKSKYIKYKLKYLQLKKMKGGFGNLNCNPANCDSHACGCNLGAQWAESCCKKQKPNAGPTPTPNLAQGLEWTWSKEERHKRYDAWLTEDAAKKEADKAAAKNEEEEKKKIMSDEIDSLQEGPEKVEAQRRLDFYEPGPSNCALKGTCDTSHGCGQLGSRFNTDFCYKMNEMYTQSKKMTKECVVEPGDLAGEEKYAKE
jgi:hypothetical protein